MTFHDNNVSIGLTNSITNSEHNSRIITSLTNDIGATICLCCKHIITCRTNISAALTVNDDINTSNANKNVVPISNVVYNVSNVICCRKCDIISIDITNEIHNIASIKLIVIFF